MFKSLAEPNITKSYKLEWVLNKNLESFPSAMFPKLWNAIEKVVYLGNKFSIKKLISSAYFCFCIHYP